jgi:hypothetical protein
MFNPKTVGDLIGIDPEDVRDVLDYVVGTEPTSSPKPESSARSKRLARRQLDAFARDAEAGASDAEIARRAGCSIAQVRRWRLRLGVRHAAGRPSTQALTNSLAVVLFGNPFEPVISHVKSNVDGLWQPPEYVRRERLDYTSFVEAIALLTTAGFSPAKLASALGVCARDIDHAIKIGARPCS